MSMVEVMVTVVLANVGLVALAISFTHVQRVELESRARNTAISSAHSVMESIKASNFTTLDTQYNDIDGDDPNGEDRGSFFSVAGLKPPAISGSFQQHGEIILIKDESPSELDYGRDFGTNGLHYLDGNPDGLRDGIDLNADKELSYDSVFEGRFDLDLNGTVTRGDLKGEYQAASPQEAFKSLRCAVRVTYEVLGELRQVEIQTQLTEPVE